MNKLSMSIILLFCIIAQTATAQERHYAFSLDEATTFALEHNKTIQMAEKDVAVSQKQYWQSIAIGLPQIGATADYSSMFNYEMTMEMPGTNAEIKIPLKDQSSLKGTFQQLIFSGQYLQGIQIAKIVKQLSQQAYQLSELDVKENVANAYFLILITESSKNIVEMNLKDIEQIMQHTQNLYNVGMVESTDVDQLKITVSQLKNALSTLQNSISLNYNLLRFHLGLSNLDEIKLSDNLDYFLNKQFYNNIVNTNFNIDNNIQYQMVEMQETISKKQVGLKRWAFAPSIVGVYSYTEKILKSSFDMSPKNLLNFTMSIPIFSSWDRRSQLGQAQIEYEKSQLNTELVRDQLMLQENQLRNDLKNAIDNYLLQNENIEVAQRVFQNYRNKYESGMLSSMELTQANSNYLTAQTNYLNAAMNLLQAQLKLQKILNTL